MFELQYYNHKHYHDDDSSSIGDDYYSGCGCKMECNTQSLEQIKAQTLAHSSNYIGISKKMAYGRYIRTTPGMETFASKKIPVMQPMVNTKLNCFSQFLCQKL